MGKIMEVAEALWQGQASTRDYHPFAPPYGTEQISRDTWFNKGFANTIIRRTDDGLVVIDTGGFFDSKTKFKSIRKHLSERLHTAIFTHGHTDHVFGVHRFVEEARESGWPRPRTVAHQAILERFSRYRESVGWNSIINGRQFSGNGGQSYWPDQFPAIDITYSQAVDLSVGGAEIHLRHSRGETDDHTWVYFSDTGVLATGDMFIYAMPNAGNPQKVQRYAADWAVALRRMAALEPEVLAPGHGFPIVGRQRVRKALLDTAEALESLHQQTLALMNQGASLDRILQSVQVPPGLSQAPYLQPVYDEPEFIVRNIYRLYGGWYDGIPSHLKPAPQSIQAREIAALAGGVEKLAARARDLAAGGDLRMACHLADWALQAEPGNAAIKETAREVYLARVDQENSTMAKGVFLDTARSLGADPDDQRMEPGYLIGRQAALAQIGD